jgi:hypothetical protein
MSTFPPKPPPDRRGDAGPAIIVSGRLSDVVRSVPDPGSDLFMAAMWLDDWEKLGDDQERAAGVIAAQAFGQTLDATRDNDLQQRPTARQRDPGGGYDRLFLALASVYTTADKGREAAKAQKLADALRPLRDELRPRRRADGGEGNLDTVLDESARVFVSLKQHFQSDLALEQDLRNSWFFVRDQLGSSGCVGWAVADLLWRQREQPVDVPSARFIWQAAKELDGDSRPTTMIGGAGTSVRAALSVARDHGLALEAEIASETNHLYPGSVSEFHQTIGRRRIRNFINLGSDAKVRLAWMSLGRPIVCSFAAGRNFVNSRGQDAVVRGEAPGASDLFGHAVLLMGYRVGHHDANGDWQPCTDLSTLIAEIRREEGDMRAREDEMRRFPAEVTGKGQQRVASPAAGVSQDDGPSRPTVQYLIRNSAGEDWGDHGYAWMDQRDFDRQVRESFGIFCSDADFDRLVPPQGNAPSADLLAAPAVMAGAR